MVPSDESEETQLSLDLTKISRFHFKTKCKIHSGVIYHYMELICDLILAAKNRGTNVTHFFWVFPKTLAVFFLFLFACFADRYNNLRFDYKGKININMYTCYLKFTMNM